MQALSNQQLLRIWEVGLGQHPLDRAITILTSAFPDVPYDHLTSLSIGQRDACLFAVRASTFGSRLVSFVVCPACQGQLELLLDMADLPIVSIAPIAPDTLPEGKMQPLQQITSEGYDLQFRVPTSLDLAAIAGCTDVGFARTLLATRCIVQAMQGGVAVAVEELPERVLTTVEAQMDTSDPLAALDVGLDCSHCGSHVQVLFDIVAFFWAEITAQARRLLRDVHTLAQAYGWRETDILSMSTARRQVYLEMVP